MTVLVVDDETAITETLADLLEMAGYRPVSAANGREGLELFDRESPALVITDAMMPHLDGRELVRTIRKKPNGRDVPIILMSAAHDLARDEGIGHDVFIAKPFDLDRFLEQVDALLASARPGAR